MRETHSNGRVEGSVPAKKLFSTPQSGEHCKIGGAVPVQKWFRGGRADLVSACCTPRVPFQPVRAMVTSIERQSLHSPWLSVGGVSLDPPREF